MTSKPCLWRTVLFVTAAIPAPLLAQPAAPAAAPPPSAEAAEATTPETAAPADTAPAQNASLETLKARIAEQDARLQAQDAQLQALQAQAASAQAAAEEAASSAEMAVEMSMGADAEPEDEVLRLYGFVDMAFKKIYVPDESRFKNLIDDNSTFALGNINFYFDAKPNDQIRTLTEVRYTLYPFGSPADGFDTTDTRVLDITSATGRNTVAWSGMVLERSWIEWGKYDAFRLRVGYFLTPYGIWNVDHGSPVLISSVLPGFWAGEYFPTRQLGLQALGNVFAGSAELGYRLWVGNGRNPGQLDVDKNKHVGGRVYATFPGSTEITLGASGFWGRNLEFEKSIASTTPFRVGKQKTLDYSEYGFGGDFALNADALRIRAEIVSNTEWYATGFREMNSPVTYQRDRTRWDAYLIVAYRIEDLEPFIYLEHDRRPSSEDDAGTMWSGGLIYHFVPKTQLKFQAYHVAFLETQGFPNASQGSFSGWDMRLVTAF